MLGREMEMLVNSYRVAGKHTVVFDAARFSSGIYFYTLQTDNGIETKMMLLLR
jgi:hypothetical protein